MNMPTFRHPTDFRIYYISKMWFVEMNRRFSSVSRGTYQISGNNAHLINSRRDKEGPRCLTERIVKRRS